MRAGLFVLILLLPAAAPSQQQEKSPPEYKVRVDVVSLDVEVLDRDGYPVPWLTKEDFRVRENGRDVEVSNFAIAIDRSVSLVFVLDTSAMTRDKMLLAKDYISRLAHLLGREDEIALYTYGSRDALLELDLTRDRTSLTEALSNIDVPGGSRRWRRIFGDSHAALGFDVALQKAQEGANERRAIFVVSDRFKGLGPATEDHVRESGCIVLTLEFTNRANAIVTLGGDRITTQRMVRDSGGRRLAAGSERVEEQCRSVARSLKNYYSLGYRTELTESRGRKRKIEVTLPGLDYQVKSRRAYAGSGGFQSSSPDRNGPDARVHR